MSSKNKLKRKSKVNLFFNHQINIFPEDFFSTFDKKSNYNKDKNKQNTHPKIILPRFKENLKTDLYNKRRNQNKNNEEIGKDNFTNIIRLDNINNLDFSFKAPSTPNNRNNISNKIHSNSNSVITKTNSFKPIFLSPFNSKIKKYDLINKSIHGTNINKNNINSNKTPKLKCYNIKCNELFKETKFNFLKNKNIKNIEVYSQKDINLNKIPKRNEKYQIKLKKNRFLTPVIKNRVIKIILNINKSKEIILKSSSLESINDKYLLIEKDKKTKEKSKNSALKSNSLKYLNTNSNSVADEKKKNKSKSKSKLLSNINNFNKRAHSSKIYNKNSNINFSINKTQNNTNSKNNTKKTIKATIDKIFREMPKNFEENPVILYKFNSLIRNMKKFQQIIKSRQNSFCSDKDIDED